MYTENETEISKSNLSSVISNTKEPVCLLGGWAVYIAVNQRFKADQGRNYLGSRDIDLGFYIDDTWSDEQLQRSAFSRSIKTLKNIKYYGIGSRLVQHYDLQTKKILTEAESKRRLKYEMFDLFVDLIVDKIHPRTKKLFGLVPIDEPFLTDVFLGNLFSKSKYFGSEILLPHTEVLVSMKINSVLGRNKEDKRIKDIADIYSLMWYTDEKFLDLKNKVQKICGTDKISSTVSGFSDKDYSLVSQATGIDKDKILRVIAEMAKR